MSSYNEKLKRHAAAWVLKSLYTNDLWFDESKGKKGNLRNYLFIPLFDIAQASGRFDLNTLKETCYLLQENHHINIWGDDYDPRAMLIQISDEGIQAYKKSFYARDYQSLIRKSLSAAAVIAFIFTMATMANKYYQEAKQQKYQSPAQNKNILNGGMSQKSTASLKVGAK